ncbi:divergent polysaccharide deacetylase family protein [Breznakiella homolactica]|uniref:Divergent polysaccharide deacetylase family protein n=1 Tax=Breznakiella homolactica TaxID=2798577 RepID=A0A7T7XMY4_9SPIR|nr:divergent polysaccharide deacetylase family protein [Breznakiella homolactica]QQO09314.1 divergent polysaccharide deacetylase family protein [Breznakiella homolactica]
MKKSTKKPAARRKKQRSKGRRKPVFKDGLTAALTAGLLICAALVISVAVIIIHRVQSIDTISAREAPSETPPESVRDPAPPVQNIPDPPAAKPPEKAPSGGGTSSPVNTGTGTAEKAPASGPSGGSPPQTVPSAQGVPASQSRGITERPPEPPPKRKGTVVFVIDDAGNNLRELDPFLTFSGPLTIAVLPGLPHSAEAARRIRAAGKEVFLHQPMEAIGGQNPGPGALYSGMEEAEIRAIIERNLEEVGPVAGMNNHQGSKITMDEKAMETVLSVCREHGIYFLDSRTTADTVVPRVAGRMGVKIGERDVFVDNIQERAAMIRFIQDGLNKAEKKGSAVMIGHTWSAELAETLEELYPELVEQGYSLSTISRLMMGNFDDEGSWY